MSFNILYLTIRKRFLERVLTRRYSLLQHDNSVKDSECNDLGLKSQVYC